jgi:hypothetical protein
MDHHKVGLRLTALGPGSSASIDGVEIRNLLSISVECGVGTKTAVTLTFYADVSGEVDVASMASVEREFRHLRSDVSP